MVLAGAGAAVEVGTLGQRDQVVQALAQLAERSGRTSDLGLAVREVGLAGRPGVPRGGVGALLRVVPTHLLALDVPRL